MQLHGAKGRIAVERLTRRKAPLPARPRAGLRALAVALATVLAAPQAAAARNERLPGPVPAAVLEVIDGDTLAVAARIWLGQEVEALVRLDGIDAPELNGGCEGERQRARAARDALAAAVREGYVLLTDIRYDKYGGRVVAVVKDARGSDLAAGLVAAGHARFYDGGRRQAWCP